MVSFLDDSRIPDQPYPELRAVLISFVSEISAVLKENLLGVYLVGSLASGDFDLDSDIDFLAVIKEELNEENIAALQAIQQKIQGMECYPAQHLEGSYISLADLNDWRTVGQKEWIYFDNGSTVVEHSIHDNQWHVRWVLRECGVTLIGPKPAKIVQPIPLDRTREEMKAVMLRDRQGFAAEVDQPLSFWNSRFGQSFAVLTFCRMLYTLHTGKVQSKKVAAQWAKENVDRKWSNLIDLARQEREGVRFMTKIRQRAEQALLDESLEFINYVVALISQ